MLLAVPNEGHPDHCLFQGNFSGTAAVVQLWVALLMSKGENSLKKCSVQKYLQSPNRNQ